MARKQEALWCITWHPPGLSLRYVEHVEAPTAEEARKKFKAMSLARYRIVSIRQSEPATK